MMLDDFKYEFLAKNNEAYLIVFSEDGMDVEVLEKDGSKLGSISFDIKENGLTENYYLVQNLSLDNCKHIGIGTEIFKLHNEIFQTPIIARENDGIKYEDGSHLTGDGVLFIEKMRKKGYVTPIRNDDDFE